MKPETCTRRQFLAASGTVGLTALGVTRPLGAGVASRYEAAVLAKKPVAYWRLGEAAGPDALDSTGNGHRGTYRGIAAFQERGAIQGDTNPAIRLDGRRSYVEIPDHPDFSQPTSGKGLTVEAWVRPDVLDFAGESDAGYIHWLGKGEAKRHEWALRFYSASAKDRPQRISAYLFNPAGGLGAGAYFQDRLRAGEWLHVVACYEPGDAGTPGRPGVQIYKNGERRQGPPAAGTLYNNPRWQIRPAHGAAPLRLGTYSRKGFLAGGLDEVAIYPRVLTAQEVLENYQTGKGR
jgi:Concanavalin A-like lectin/glucanases superfamily